MKTKNCISKIETRKTQTVGNETEEILFSTYYTRGGKAVFGGGGAGAVGRAIEVPAEHREEEEGVVVVVICFGYELPTDTEVPLVEACSRN